MKLIHCGLLCSLLLMSCGAQTPMSATTPETPTTDTNGVTQTVPTVETSAWDGFCAVARALTWDPKDTDVTIIEIKQHNYLGHVHCGWPE